MRKIAKSWALPGLVLLPALLVGCGPNTPGGEEGEPDPVEPWPNRVQPTEPKSG